MLEFIQNNYITICLQGYKLVRREELLTALTYDTDNIHYYIDYVIQHHSQQCKNEMIINKKKMPLK